MIKKIFSIIICTLLFLLVGLMVLGYFISRKNFRNPPERYFAIGKRVYTAAPAMMIDSSFDSLNLSGRSVRIGVLDTEFGGLRDSRWTRNMKVEAYADFIDGDTTGFFKDKTGGRAKHGAYSCACIGGYIPGDTVKGLAWNASYYLAEIDDIDAEPRLEEERMMNAVRWLLSHDVDIITSSCSYTLFDDFDGYSTSMLDGHSSRLSAFVDSVLQANPNLIFVQCIGNEGDTEWHYNSFPSDVREAISVGAVTADGSTRARYSSFGWDGTEYIKPDVCAYVQPPLNGTSFAAPAITGLCAALLEHRHMSRRELIELLHESGSNASAPNRETGYGVPRTDKMHLLQ